MSYLCRKEQYCRLRGTLADTSGHFDSIQFRKSNVQQDQVWFQYLGFLNRFQAIRGLPNDLQVWPSLKRRTNESTPRFVIINDQNAYETSRQSVSALFKGMSIY